MCLDFKAMMTDGFYRRVVSKLQDAEELGGIDPLSYIDLMSKIETEVRTRRENATQLLLTGRKFNPEYQNFVWLENDEMMWCPVLSNGLPDISAAEPVDTWNIQDPEQYQRDLDDLKKLPKPVIT